MAVTANPKQNQTKAAVEEEAPLYGDVLESVLSKLHLIHLLSACHVSKSWNRAVSSTLRFSNRVKPWLVVHTQTTRFPYVVSARAYDPASHVWVDLERSLHHPPVKSISTLRSSHSTLLYMLSPSKFAFSLDALHLEWSHANTPPLVWRTDPIVAVVGHRVVVAGGACDYEDDPLAVEMYDVKVGTWDTCESMPAIFKDSSASTWLSVAADERRMYVTERCSAVTYSFDPESKKWFGPYDLRPNPTVFSSVIGFVNGRLVLAGVVGAAEDVKGVKLWEVEVSDDESLELKEMIGDMPETMVEKLKGERDCEPSFSMSYMGGMVCFHNGSDPSELILCELDNGGCRWTSMRNDAVNDGTRMQRMVVTCANLGLPELHKAVQVGALKIL
ncbi:putative F-box domain, kelch-type beta propeller [Rosa chinensis]|uniref:Putative F-box domain, kelch-type beta propeller n=1 Tax=Rosa chinensis TaxID=74649 RepID=A0A2P6R3I3_ROSCH|nr:F-box/kelch-repeat protein At1g23390 [Rosa chinensis]PRQ40978.1 putative F-box domain, kelch-type beta propeller [Rosa chinensis]